MQRSSPLSLEGRLALVTGGALALGAGLGVAAYAWLEAAALAVAVALLAGLPLAVYFARAAARPFQRFVVALAGGLAGFRDGDFSLSLARPRRPPELADLVDAYNAVGERFREERQSLHQRELLLDTVIQTTPLALVLTNDDGAVIYSNLAARRLFLAGRKLEGHGFNALVESAPEPLREAIAGGTDTLFTMNVEGEAEIFHLSLRRFLLNARPHHLYLLKQLTRELNAQEVATWKKVIRVIAHELNNSLAPISSLAHSGRLVAAQSDAAQRGPQLDRVFATIEERAAHLHAFIDGYARFAKLPQPRPAAVAWEPFLARLRGTAEFRLRGEPPDVDGWFDATQLEQVLINLVKNAHESGSARSEVVLEIERRGRGVELRVLDRGTGMSDAVLQQALLPFYSTKPAGTGLGLTLSREIAEAHGGRLTVAPRDGGGMVVSVWLPDAEA
jgi:nitrogen fixation/metabolism regulation signal transduction histidine kinase